MLSQSTLSHLIRPRSVLRLVLFGFFLVALPLILAIIQAGVFVDRLVVQSRHAVLQGVIATQSSQKLLSLVNDMERRVRQYRVVPDPTLRTVFGESYRGFQKAISEIAPLLSEQARQQTLQRLQTYVNQVASVLAQPKPDAKALDEAIDRFADIALLAQKLVQERDVAIDRELKDTQAIAEEAQKALTWEILALVPATGILILVLSYVIARPIKQIDRAIHQLGEAGLAAPVEVKGPQDLEQLGKRLEWLRLRLIELEEQKTKFLSQMSHELKTPLASIREGAELLGDGVVGQLTSGQREVVDILSNSARQLQKIIEGLLDYHRLQAKRPTLNLKSFDIKSLADDVLGGFKLACVTKNLKLNAKGDALAIVADYDKLRTVLDNLVSNAVNYSQSDGAIEVAWAAMGDRWRLSVTDQGPGVPMSERVNIFEPFFQGSAPRRGYVKGSGIGLAVSKEYVLAHQGEIKVIDHEGPGACFQIELPSAQLS